MPRARRARPRPAPPREAGHDRRPAGGAPTSPRWSGRRTGTPRPSTRCCTCPRWCWSTPSTSSTPRVRRRRARRQLARSAYVVDLAWLRSTPWRERVAATFDPPQWRDELGRITSVKVQPPPGVRRPRGCCSAAGWRRGWTGSRVRWWPRNGSLHGKRPRAPPGRAARRSSPTRRCPCRGWPGSDLGTASGMTIALDRGPGGLTARRRDRKGNESTWTVLGRLARRVGHPRRGNPPGAAARPRLRGRAQAGRRDGRVAAA